MPAEVFSQALKSKCMKLKTRVFELSQGKYRNLSELARAMEISLSQLWRVREGKRRMHESFIIGAIKAFPEYKLEDLIYVDSGEKDNE